MNQVTLVGRLTKDPEVRWNNDMAIASFTVAVDRRRGRDGQQEADFIRCKAFYKTAENMERYCYKGQRVGIVGSIQTGSYQNREGQTIYTTDVVCNNVEFLEHRDRQGDQQQQEPGQESISYREAPQGFEAVNDDSIPF